MCNPTCIEFGRSYLSRAEVRQKKVIEVGAYAVNGSLRNVVENLEPLSYVGVDIERGPGVDELCAVEDLVTRFGRESFDVVICTELLEHVIDWRKAVSNLKNILKPNGTLLLSTRSRGFRYHGYPFDFWRYEVADMEVLFADLSIDVIEKDAPDPGVFVKAHKPFDFSESDLQDYDLFSIVRQKYCKSVGQFDVYIFKPHMILRRYISRILPTKLKKIISDIFLKYFKIKF
jgi:SAM-dependent methyltransferase